MKKYKVFAVLACLLLSGCQHTHEYGEWVETKAATCTAKGEERRECGCGEYETRAINMESHTPETDEAVAPSCTEEGLTEGSHCSVCGKTIVAQTKVDKLAHSFSSYVETEIATTDKEGKLVATCTRSDCSETKELKLMKTPALSIKNGVLSWPNVPIATGYKLYDGADLIGDLGYVNSYVLPIIEGMHSYSLEAYTTTSDYDSHSKKSSPINVTVGYGVDMQQMMRTNFEGFDNSQSKLLNGEFYHHYANYSAGNVEVILDSTSTGNYAKLRPFVNDSVATITKACNANVLKAGTYKLTFDLKKGITADGTLSFGFFNGTEWLPNAQKTIIDISSLDVGGWNKIEEVEYTLTTDKVTTFANLDIEYKAVVADANNYVAIDNIQIIDVATSTNVDANMNNDFESFKHIPSLNTPGVWERDSIGNLVFVNDGKLENSIVSDNDNYYLKAFTSNALDATFTVPVNVAVAQEGVYKISIKAKLGAGAMNVDNIGLRLSSTIPLGTPEIVFLGLDNLSGADWVTLDAYFTVNQTVTVPFINADFWVLTHNDQIHREDNYVLIDDIEIRKVNYAFSN